MSFIAKSFIFNDVPSENYDLRVFNFERGGLGSSVAGGDIEIISKEMYRRPIPYFYGVQQKPVLRFPLTFGSYNAMDATTRGLIQQKLFGQTSYNKLQLVQCDMDNVYFNVFLTNPKNAYIGNLNYAFSCEVVCDSPWAWGFEKTYTKSYPGGGIASDSFTFYNGSANNEYLYPTLEIELNGVGTGVTIINETDSNRSFAFTGLSAYETLTVDNDRKILTSDTGLRRLSGFNLNWFRLLPGYNTISVSGGIENIDMSYQFAHRVGG